MGLKIKAELGGDGTGFERMMTRAGSTANRFASGTIAPLKNMIAGAFSVGAISALSRGIIESASHLRDLSDELGVNVEWLQAMQFHMKANGASADDLAKTLLKINEARQAAMEPSGGKKLAAFGAFGVSPQQVQTAKLTDIFDKVAEAFRTGSQQQLEPAFREIGGKGAATMIPSFVAGILSGREAAQQAGAVIAEDVIDQLDALSDAADQLKIEIGANLAPVLIRVTTGIRGFWYIIREFGAWLLGFVSSLGSNLGKLANPFVSQTEKGGIIRDALKQGKEYRAAENLNQQDQIDREQAALRTERAARKRRENPNLNFTALEPQAEKFRFAKNSDALTGIGNFLGGSGAGADLVSIGEKTNQLLTQANTHLAGINTKLASSGGDGGVPST